MRGKYLQDELQVGTQSAAARGGVRDAAVEREAAVEGVGDGEDVDGGIEFAKDALNEVDDLKRRGRQLVVLRREEEEEAVVARFVAR